MSSLNQPEPEENGGESPKNEGETSSESEENGEESSKNEGETSSDELNELKELLQRTQANFENYRKQTEKRVEEMIQIATKGIITQILPILDNFELALQTAEMSSGQPEFVQGITLIHSQLTKTLKDNGVKEIKVEGTFDPHIHEALMKMPSELPENSITGVIQKGYTLHGKLLRPARVTLSAGQIKSTDEQNKTKNKN